MFLLLQYKMKASNIIGIVVLLILVVTVTASLIPVADDSLDQLSDDYICNQESGCIYNATVSSTVPCRNETNQVASACPTGAGDTVPLGNLPQTILIIVIMAGLIVGMISVAKGMKNK